MVAVLRCRCSQSTFSIIDSLSAIVNSFSEKVLKSGRTLLLSRIQPPLNRSSCCFFQLPMALSASIPSCIHPFLPFIFHPADTARILAYSACLSSGHRFAVSGGTCPLQQFPEIPVTVFVSSAFYMKMIMTQFMFQDADHFFPSMDALHFWIHLDGVISKHIPAPSCAEAGIIDSLMHKRLMKIAQGELLGQ